MNDQTRQIIGTSLLFALFTLFFILNTPQEPKADQEDTAKKEVKKLGFLEKIEKKIGPCLTKPSQELAVLESDAMKYSVDSHGRITMESRQHNNAQNRAVHMRSPLVYWGIPTGEASEINLFEQAYSLAEKTATSVRLVYNEGEERSITMTYTLLGDELQQRVELKGWAADRDMELLCYDKAINQEPNKGLSERKTYLAYNKTWMRSASAQDGKEIKKVAYAAFNMPYFTKALIFEEPMHARVALSHVAEDEAIKKMVLRTTLPIEACQKAGGYVLHIYAGANTYDAMSRLAQRHPGKGLEQVYYFGWGIFGGFNRYVLTPCFDVLHGMVGHVILALFLLLLLLSLMSFFFIYKQYIQQVKMKAAKPYLEAIKEKKGDESRFEESNFYRKVGINPLMMIFGAVKQIVIFVALLSFVTYNMAFRQQGFLWIKDVTNIDDTIKLPFYVWKIGNHISVIALLLVGISLATTIFTKKEADTAAASSKGQARVMKVFQYVMPVLFFGITNARSAIFGIARLLNMAIERGEKLLCRLLVNKKAITEEVVRRATAEDDKKPSTSRGMSRLQRRMSKKNK